MTDPRPAAATPSSAAPSAASNPAPGAPAAAPPPQRMRPLEAWRALRRLVENPDDTSQVFVIIDALSGKSGERMFRRFRKSEVGARVLAEKRDVTPRLADTDALLALPEGSLGHTYARFMQREQLSPDGLAEASETRPNGARYVEDEDRTRFGTRLRDTHDLWHVVTGYGRDLVGEAALLSFTYAQTRELGIGVIVLMAWWLARGEIAYGRRMIREAYRRGRAAAWLPAADWEALLERPLHEVRRELGVGEPPVYREVRSAAGEAALAG